jgi:hypothetical protein
MYVESLTSAVPRRSQCLQSPPRAAGAPPSRSGESARRTVATRRRVSRTQTRTDVYTGTQRARRRPATHAGGWPGGLVRCTSLCTIVCILHMIDGTIRCRADLPTSRISRSARIVTARSTAASFLTRKKTVPCRILLVLVQHYSESTPDSYSVK